MTLKYQQLLSVLQSQSPKGQEAKNLLNNIKIEFNKVFHTDRKTLLLESPKAWVASTNFELLECNDLVPFKVLFNLYKRSKFFKDLKNKVVSGPSFSKCLGLADIGYVYGGQNINVPHKKLSKYFAVRNLDRWHNPLLQHRDFVKQITLGTNKGA